VRDASLARISVHECTVDMLVNDLTKQLGCKSDDVIENLMELQSSGMIRITEGRPFNSIGSYILSPASLWFWGDVIATFLSVVLISFASHDALYLHYALGGLLILFLPGDALVELMYAGKTIGRLMQITLSVAMSLALVAAAGVILNSSPFGIDIDSVAYSIAMLTFILLGLAVIRKFNHYRATIKT
jgi:hypothetical protein